MKNEVVVQSQAVILRNLENHNGQLATTLSNKSQGSLPSTTEDPRREGKEHCNVINLKFGKDVDIPIGMPRRMMEPNLTLEETQAERNP